MAIARVYFNQDLRYGIDGLTKELQAKRISQKAISSNDMSMFVNIKRTHVKIFWGGQYVLSYRKNPGQGKITVADIKAIPRFFKDGMLNSSMEKNVMPHLEKGIHVLIDEDGLKVG